MLLVVEEAAQEQLPVDLLPEVLVVAVVMDFQQEVFLVEPVDHMEIMVVLVNLVTVYLLVEVVVAEQVLLDHQ
jgi:hypothetical protein